MECKVCEVNGVLIVAQEVNFMDYDIMIANFSLAHRTQQTPRSGACQGYIAFSRGVRLPSWIALILGTVLLGSLDFTRHAQENYRLARICRRDYGRADTVYEHISDWGIHVEMPHWTTER